MNSSKIYSLALSGFVKHPYSGEQIFKMFSLETLTTKAKTPKFRKIYLDMSLYNINININANISFKYIKCFSVLAKIV